MSLWVILLAGGKGARLSVEANKVYLPVADREMIEYPLETFEACSLVHGIVVVVRAEDTDHAHGLLTRRAPSKESVVVTGGETRHQSERRGIEALAGGIRSGKVEWVAVHDGARPFVTKALLETLMREASRSGGAVPALPPQGPLYERRGSELIPLDPATARRAQTPQVFRGTDLIGAFRRAEPEGFEGVDTAETVERYADVGIGLVPGDPRNVKVTFLEDLVAVERHAKQFRRGRWIDSP